MDALFILWGLLVVFIGFTKYYKHLPVDQWSYKRMYFMFAYCMWGFGFAASGLGGFIPQIAHGADIFYGTTFLLMVFAPCGMEMFNTQPVPRVARNITFISIGAFIIIAA